MRFVNHRRGSFASAIAELRAQAVAAMEAGDPQADVAAEFERAEFDLLLDHRLRRRLSKAEREALWTLRNRAVEQQTRTLRGMDDGTVTEPEALTELQSIAADMVAGMSAILTPEEASALFGEGGGALPAG